MDLLICYEIRPNGRMRQYLTPWVSILFQRCLGVAIILMKAVLTLSFTFIDLELSFKKNDPGRHLSNAVCELLNLLHQSYIVTGGSVRLFNTTDGSSGLNWFGRVLSDLRRWVNTCGGMHCIGVTMWVLTEVRLRACAGSSQWWKQLLSFYSYTGLQWIHTSKWMSVHRK